MFSFSFRTLIYSQNIKIIVIHKVTCVQRNLIQQLLSYFKTHRSIDCQTISNQRETELHHVADDADFDFVDR